MTLPYIINVALILLACLAFYKILLRRETFYTINRYVLLLCLGIAFVLPLVQVPGQFSLRKENGLSPNAKEETVTAKSETSNQQQAANANSAENVKPQQPITNNPSVIQNNPTAINDQQKSFSFSYAQLMSWSFWIYWFGVFVFAASFIFQLVLLLMRAYRNPVIIDGPYRIVEISGDKAPCSFGNTIFINPSKYDWETYNQILMHEKVHIREKHTIDIVLAEVLLIFQWFNPFAWIYRQEIESNLEFLTDDQMMNHEKLDKKIYQLSLVMVSAPHLPLNLTTNYNQSILKTRIAMMNKKRSSLHSAWKYFFLLPVFVFLACLLNEPMAKAQTVIRNGEIKNHAVETKGYWFAIIKNDEVNIRFSNEKIESENWDSKSGHSWSGTSFKLSDLGNLPEGSAGTFNITREAGTMQMNGKFDGKTGMGTYKFVVDKSFLDYMNKELKETLDEDDQMAFFFINIRKDYLTMMQKEGFTKITKDDLVPLAALKVDAAYIKSIKEAGFKDLDIEKLVPLKSLNIDAAYIKQIRDAGYNDITSDQLVTFKSQGIDKKYIESFRDMKGLKEDKGNKNDPDDIVTFKAMNITAEFINSFKAVGFNNIPYDRLIAFKSLGVTPEYIKSWQTAGFNNLDVDDLTGMKSQNVTPEFMKSFTDLGYKNIKPEDLIAIRSMDITPGYIKNFENAGYKIEDFDELLAIKSMNITPEFMKSFIDLGYKNNKPGDFIAVKSMGITPEYIRSFENAGYKNIDFDQLSALKSLKITPEFIRSFEAVGFKNIDLDEILSIKSVGVTSEYIKNMKSKGFNYDNIQKYVTLKSLD